MGMSADCINELNDCPWFWGEREGFTERVAFLVREIGMRHPMAVVVASNRDELFETVNQFGDPDKFVVTVMIGGECFRRGTIFAMMDDRCDKDQIWRPVDDGTTKYSLAADRAEKLARLENEVADLQGIFRDLNRTANDRFNGHRRRARKDAGAVEETGSGQDQPHRGSRSYRLRKDGTGHPQGRNRRSTSRQ